jgi:probable rRNA maturation factor
VVQNATQDYVVPTDENLSLWVNTALQSENLCYALTIRMVDEKESCNLNSTYRNKDSATNILSFPVDLEDMILKEIIADTGVKPLGDLAVCVPIVMREASEQNKALFDHWAHLVIHGVLHLRGFDHIEPEQAASMEKLEKSLLATLGIDDPYLIN